MRNPLDIGDVEKEVDGSSQKTIHKKQKASVNILQDLERLEKAGLSEIDIKAILRL